MNFLKINFVIFVIVVFCDCVLGGLRFKRQNNDRIVFPDEDDFRNEVQVKRRQSSSDRPEIYFPGNDIINNDATTQSTSTVTRRTTPSPQFIQCMKSCPTTPQYNPVCGTDQFVYTNEQRLECARYCGTDVRIAGRGNCVALFGRARGQW